MLCPSAVRGPGGPDRQQHAQFQPQERRGPRPEDITAILDKTLELASTDYNLKKNYDFKKIQVVREYEPALPMVLGSASKLQQVFLNLFRNGAEAMGEKATRRAEPALHPAGAKQPALGPDRA
jgi:nitrogen-specific signal transduction histidine kinase